MNITITETKAKDVQLGDEVLILRSSNSITQNKVYPETFVVDEILTCGGAYEFTPVQGPRYKFYATQPNEMMRVVA